MNIPHYAAVFTCEVVATEEREGKPIARVRVLRSWKGVRPGSTILLWGRKQGFWVEDALNLEPKQRYLIYADSTRGRDDYLATDICRGSHGISSRGGDAEVASLGPSLRTRAWWKWWGGQ